MVSLLALAGCRGQTQNPDDTMGAEDDSGTGDDGSEGSELVTYDNFGDAFLRNWCRGCHSSELSGDARSGAPEGVDFNTLEDAQMFADRIAARALGDAPSMPPAGGPSSMELELLQQWLDADAP